jgi:hypothetical protein
MSRSWNAFCLCAGIAVWFGLIGVLLGTPTMVEHHGSDETFLTMRMGKCIDSEKGNSTFSMTARSQRSRTAGDCKWYLTRQVSVPFHPYAEDRMSI